MLDVFLSKVYIGKFVAVMLNSRAIKLANIREKKVHLNDSEFTVFESANFSSVISVLLCRQFQLSFVMKGFLINFCSISNNQLGKKLSNFFLHILCSPTPFQNSVFIQVNVPSVIIGPSHFLWEKDGQMPPKMALWQNFFCIFSHILSQECLFLGPVNCSAPGCLLE